MIRTNQYSTNNKATRQSSLVQLPLRLFPAFALIALVHLTSLALADEPCDTKKEPDPLGACTIAPAPVKAAIARRICLGENHPRCFELGESAGIKKIYTLSQIIENVRGSTREILADEYKALNSELAGFAAWAKEKQKSPSGLAKSLRCQSLVVIESLGGPRTDRQEFCRAWLPKKEQQKKIESLIERFETAGAKSSKL